MLCFLPWTFSSRMLRSRKLALSCAVSRVLKWEGKRVGGENGDRERKREGGENGDGERKGGDRMQQQTAGRAANVEDKGVKADEPATSRTSARLNEPATQRTSGAGQSSGLAQGAAARRRQGQDDAANIAATTNI